MTIETVERVVGLLSEYLVSEITLEQGGERVCVRRGPALPAPPSLAASVLPSGQGEAEALAPSDAEASALPDLEPIVLAAPMVGLFHHLPSPLRYGTGISTGQVVGHIESMKLMNDVLADQAGQIVEVLAEDGSAVEYGQPLFRLTP